MRATVTKRKIDHNDPSAAGFTDGYWWRAETEHGVVESGAATQEEAVRRAAELAGVDESDVAVS